MKVTNLLGLASIGTLSLAILSSCSKTDGSQYSTALECMNSETKDGADPRIAIEFCKAIFAEKAMDREISCRADPTGSGCAPYVARARKAEELSNSRCNRENKTYNFKKMREAGYSDQEIITYLEKECSEFRHNQDAAEEATCAAAEPE